jgi:hypothetical protein
MINMLRKLRIAFSALCGIACLLLIVLWVRSYSYLDDLSAWLTRHQFTCISGRGWTTLGWDWHNFQLYGPFELRGLEIETYRIKEKSAPTPTWHLQHFSRTAGEHHVMAIVPYWFLLSITAVPGVLLWRPWSWRFSLRTVLIATTLVAVFLGAVFYAVSNSGKS